MHIIGTFLFLILFVLVFMVAFGLSLLARLFGGVRNLWNIFMGNGLGQNGGGYSRSNTGTYNNGDSSQSQQSGESADQGHRPHSRGVFADDEGTYVDFEEVKED